MIVAGIPTARIVGRSVAFDVVVIVEQDPLSGAFKILELSAAHGPKKCREAEQAEEEGDGNEVKDDVHELGRPGLSRPLRLRLPPRRSALPTTSNEDADMHSAAISGVISPITARGIASAL